MQRPEYTLTRDLIDNNRINLQHHLWIELFGYYVHPSISLPVRDSEPPGRFRIADVGTGTGVWMTGLRRQVPDSIQLDGLDISFDAAPPPKWLPSNIALKKLNIFEPPPMDLIGAYDLVHIRNFAFVLQDADLPSVAAHLVSLLKPGGFLQWGEPDVSSFRIETTDSRNEIDALTALIHVSQRQDERLKPEWVSGLPEILREAGLIDIETDVKDAPPHLAFAMHQCNLVIHSLVAQQTRRFDIGSAIGDLMPMVERETKSGSCWTFTRWTVIGKKV